MPRSTIVTLLQYYSTTTPLLVTLPDPGTGIEPDPDPETETELRKKGKGNITQTISLRKR